MPSVPSLPLLAPVRAGGGEPLHRQVENRLRQLVATPAFRRGALLPDELTLANRLGVSRGTARMALTRLVQAGVLERRAGVGTRVARPQAESGILAWRSFSREMAAKGVTVQNFRTTLRPHPAPAAVAAALQIARGTTVYRLDRVRGWNGQPILLSQSWLHPRLRLTGREDCNRPLYEWIEAATGIRPDAAREEFAAIAAPAATARLLRVRPGTPLLLRRHIVADASGRPMEYAEVRYVSARFTLTLDLRRAQA